jgi:hypothetical protein
MNNLNTRLKSFALHDPGGFMMVMWSGLDLRFSKLIARFAQCLFPRHETDSISQRGAFQEILISTNIVKTGNWIISPGSGMDYCRSLSKLQIQASPATLKTMMSIFELTLTFIFTNEEVAHRIADFYRPVNCLTNKFHGQSINL